MHPTAGQFPDQPGVDGPQLDLAPRRPLAPARNGVQQPCELGRREIGIQDQSGRRLHLRLMTFGRQSRGHVGCPAVLPDDGAVQRLARRRIPDHSRLALIGDADGGEAGHAAGLANDLAAGLERRRPDFAGVMLHPAGTRKMLGQFDLADGGGTQVARLARRRLRPALESDRPRRGRALVDGEDQAHGFSPCGGLGDADVAVYGSI